MTEITWFKLWHDALDDVKFLGIADRIQSEPARVFHVFLKLLKRASENEDRGSITGFDDWGEAAWLRIPVEEVRRIVEAIRDIGMIVGDRIAKWAKRQGAAAAKLAQAAVSAGAQRMRRYRRRKAEDDRQGAFSFTEPGVTEGVTRVTSGVTDGVTSAAERETDRDLNPPRGAPPQGGNPRPRFKTMRSGGTRSAGTSAAEAMTAAAPAHQLSILLPIDGEIIDDGLYDRPRYRRTRRPSAHQTLFDAGRSLIARYERAERLSRGQPADLDCA
jgi:hypothetical protein